MPRPRLMLSEADRIARRLLIGSLAADQYDFLEAKDGEIVIVSRIDDHVAMLGTLPADADIDAEEQADGSVELYWTPRYHREALPALCPKLNALFALNRRVGDLRPFRSGTNRDRPDIQFCIEHAEYLTDWQQGFIRNVSRQEGMSEKQLRALDDIVTHLRRCLTSPAMRRPNEPA